jgi:hypothetical protein
MKPLPVLSSVRWLIALVVLLALLPGKVGAAAGPKKPNTSAAKALFESVQVPEIHIEVPEEGMKILRKYQWNFGPQENRESVRATVREGGATYTNVALHLKGAAGSFRGVEQNPALTLNFDKFMTGQHFHGLHKLSLNNSVQDPSFVSEELCRELFLKAGVPVPRATHAWVSLNGRDLGLYVLTEGWDKQFLKRHFKKTGGNLYDGGFLKDVNNELATNAGDNPKNQSDRIALAAAAAESNLTNRQARLEKVLDVDRFITFIALDVMLWDWDGYAQNRNNWRLYHDLDTDRMIFMPHGMDQMFWKPTGSILPPMQGLVAKAVLDVPEWRARYFERMKSLRASVFNPNWMTNRAYQIRATFASQLTQRSPAVAREQERAFDELCNAMVRRSESLDEQLAHPIMPLEFDGSGIAHLSGWEAKPVFGHPLLAKSPAGQAPSSLVAGAEKGSSIAMWRTQVWLEKGRYRLQGKIKTDGIVPDPGDPRGGAGFRLDRTRAQEYLLGNSGWKEMSHEFAVKDSLSQMQITCEFRGVEGKALFDVDSLALQRLPAEKTATQ